MDDQIPVLEPADELEIEAGNTQSLPQVPPISIGLADQGGAQTVMATQAIINRQVMRLDTLKSELKELNESTKSILDNDEILASAQMELSESSKKLKSRKAQLTQSAESVQIKYKVNEIREQIKELEESLNNHLLSYYQLTGTKVFDTESGEQREFRLVAKVLGKKNSAKND